MGSKAQANDDKYVLKGLAAGLIGGLVASITHVDRFRGIHEEYMRAKAIDYFENSRRAIFGQQSYAQRNPRKLIGYGRYSWGITANDGPGPAVRRINGRTRRFYDYVARSIPYGPDDGTLAPWRAGFTGGWLGTGN